jgi:hypothetical protein
LVEKLRFKTHVPFGLLFAKYMSNKGIPPIGGLFLSNGKRIGHSEMPKGLGFDTGYHVIIFVNLLTFFDQDELEYQDEYPLTKRNKREGVLDKHTMRDAIYALIERGMSSRLFLREMRFSPHCTSITMCKKDKSMSSITGAFTRLTTIPI